jgi:hypothetical protein
MHYENIATLSVGRRIVLAGLIASGAATSVLCSGCVFAVMRTARFIERKINPPQPSLHGSMTVFGGNVKVNLLLRSTEKRRRAGVFKPDDEPDDQLAAEGATEPGKNRMVLITALTNAGTSTLEVTVLSVDSLLGRAVPVEKTVALAGGQRFLLGSFRSEHEPNLDALTVTVALKHGDEVEKSEVALAPFQKKAGVASN